MMALTLSFSVCAFNGGMTASATELRSDFNTINTSQMPYNIKGVKADLNHLNRSPRLVEELDKIINSLDETAPRSYRIELDLFKLDVLAKINEPIAAAVLAEKICMDNPRHSFDSEVEYGNTMYQVVESLAKTDNLGVAYEIIQKLRMSLYEEPSHYLAFAIRKSLIEVHIETSDYQRALRLTLDVLKDSRFVGIEDVEKWRPLAITEVGYLYNQLGNGEKALEYLQQAAENLTQQDATQKSVQKAIALNFANRGRAYLLLEDYDKVREMGRNLQAANTELNQSYLTAVSHRLIGRAEYNDGRYKSAAKNFERGIKLADLDNTLSLKRSLYLDYAMTLEKMGQHKSAAHWYKSLYSLETHRQETIAATRSKLNDIEFSAYKDHQEMTHLQDELDRNQNVNKLMLLAILSLIGGGVILLWLFGNLRNNQKKLVKSEMEAKIANQTKSDFLANMSHEIRTPMNGVLGMAQVLEKTPLSSQQHFYLDIIKQSGTTLLDLINDILDFSKIEADKLMLNLKPCNLEKTVQDVVALLSPTADQKGIVLRYRFAPNFPKHFMLDGKRIRQIVMNLIGNALKFTNEGSVSVVIDGELKDGIAQITISVTDTGIGIKQDQLGMIFEKFTQASSGHNRTSGGTGLGLAISHKLSVAMKGELTVSSTYGKGSAFTLVLPAEVAAPIMIEPKNAQDNTKTVVKPHAQISVTPEAVNLVA